VNLTSKGKSALVAMLDILENSKKSTPVSLKDVSSRQNISLPYLEQIFKKLKNSNLVYSVKGPGGGYLLKSTPGSIKLKDIVEAVEDRVYISFDSKTIPSKEGQVVGQFIEVINLESSKLLNLSLNKLNAMKSLT